MTRRKRRRQKPSKIKIFFNILLFIFMIILTAGAIGYAMISPILKDAKAEADQYLKSISKDTFINLTTTEVYDYKGDLITALNISHYKYVTIDEVSEYLINGYIAVEDRKFYDHNGIDKKALVRATVALIQNKGEVTQGGSTITQQVLKNNVLQNIEDQYDRKLIEFFLSPEVEKLYSKNEIMEFYLNTNFYHYNCYGVEMAAEYYFHTTAKDLTLAQAAGLIGISNSPATYEPVKHLEAYKEKRTFVLDIMLQEGFITEEEYEIANNDPVELALYREPAIKENYMVSYTLDCLTEELMRQDGFQFKYTFENKQDYETYWDQYNTLYTVYAKKVRAGGYKIYTSFNQDIQNQLQNIVDNELKGFTEVNDDGRYNMQGSAVVINNNNNMIIAMVGGRGSDDEYNRAYQAHRQPGSAIKPIIDYGPAFDTYNYYPSKMVSRAKKNEWYPNNWDGVYSGELAIREAIARSNNTIAFDTLQQIGVDSGLNYLANMHFTGLSYDDNGNSSMAIGGFTHGTSSLEMAKAYSTIANNGIYTNPSCIRSVTYYDQPIYNYTSDEVKIYKPETAAMLIDCMKDVIYKPYGTGGMAALDNQIIAGKTGTTNDNKDGWFCGITPYYTCAVWCGFEYPKSVRDMGGGTYPCRIFKSIMNSLHQNLPAKDFEYQDTMMRNIDWKGNPVTYKTNRSDIFSKTQYENQIREVEEAEKARQEKLKTDALATVNGNIAKINALTISSYKDATTCENLYYAANKLCNQYNFEDLKTKLDTAYSSKSNLISSYKREHQEEVAREQREQERKAREIRESNIDNARKALNQYRLQQITEGACLEELNKCSSYSEYTSLMNEYNVIYLELNPPEETTEEVTEEPTTEGIGGFADYVDSTLDKTEEPTNLDNQDFIQIGAQDPEQEDIETIPEGLPIIDEGSDTNDTD